ncbi:glycoside hydrolase domain-containing protein [Nonomuraea solani]|uniref:glycoside hydrolase domain-containing protein n=1 Tax=Nonomuraea solani TaxID=1144553 RepID=UPI000CDE92BA|nr:glycoside hydrolase domain-containing protein [Nonomuraea solani]
MAVLVLLELIAVAPAHAAAGLRIWTASAADRVFSTSPPPSSAPTSIDLYSARGEQEAAQIAVRSSTSEALGDVLLTVSALTGPGGASIPTSDILLRRAYHHRDVVVMRGDVEQPPGGGTIYPDALVEADRPLTLDGGVTQPYHYSVTVPKGQTPGVYTGTVAVSTRNAGTATVNVRVVVYDVTLPEPNESTFKMNNWFTSAGWDYTGTIRAIPQQYRNAEMYSDNWWKVIESIARNHERHRNNVIYADFQALLIPGSKVGPGGELQFGWDVFDRFIETFETAKALQYIYTPTLLENPRPASADPVKAEILRNVGGVVQRVLVEPESAEANAYYDKVFPALKAHLDLKGWTDRFYMSAVDEPETQEQAQDANWLYGKYRKYFPAHRTNEAHDTVLAGLAGDLTTITPVLGHYDQNIGYYQNLRANGTELWLYNCIVPEGSQMNRFISYHLAKTRLTPWLTWKIGGTGYLHWGWNYWHDAKNPDTIVNTFDVRQTGDAWLVRPNSDKYDIYDSLRSETQLDGLEDYELLNLLAKTKPLLARLVASSLITDTVTYTRSGALVDDRHKMLLELLVDNGPDRRFPYTDNFSAGHTNWQPGKGSWSVAPTGEYLQTDKSRWDFTSTPKSSSYGDVVASVDLKIDSVNTAEGGNANWAGLVVRGSNATDMDTGYLVAVRNNGEVFIYRSGQTLAKAVAGNYRPGTYTRLRVMAFGNKISAFLGNNPQPVVSVTDNAFPAGHLALVTGGASVRFDNFTANPDDNLADGRPVTTSSSYSADGWHATAAVDGIQSSTPLSLGWTSAAGTSADRTEWISVDLQSKRSLSRVDLFPRSDGANTGLGFPVDFTVQVSADGTSWSTVASRTNQPRPGAGAQTFSFPAVEARYVKVTGTKLGSDPLGAFHMQLAEIEAYG